MYRTLISTAELEKICGNANLPTVIVDCRFSLADTNEGRHAYQQSHIPGAVYAHLDDDLSGEIILGKTGRHPLPSIEKLEQLCANWGIDSTTQVVAYDDKGGGIAARLWWMLRWLGHEQVAVLDGGWPKWVAENRPVDANIPTPKKTDFKANIQQNKWVDKAFVENNQSNPKYLLVDSRTKARYLGEEEPIDPIAGHIQSAINAPFPENLDENGQFKSKEALQERFEKLLGDLPPKHTTFYCGSGVTACHNLLAMEHAGLSGAKLYPGSWSEWLLRYL